MTRELMFSAVRVEGMTIALNADGKLPERIKVLNWGENPNFHGLAVRVGKPLMAAMSSGVYPFKRVALDFEHNTYPGSPAYLESVEPRKVAGFGTIEVVEGEGVYLCVDSWTPQGAEGAVNYCDVSAVPAMDKFGNVVAVKSVALCRNGAVPEMEFRDVALSVDSAFVDLVSTNTNKEISMEKLKAFIAKLLGKEPADVTDEEVVAEVEKKFAAGAVEPKPVDAALNVADVGAVVKAAVAQAVKELETQVVALSASVDSVKGAGVAKDKQGIIDEGRRAGKDVRLPEEAVAALSVDAIRTHVDGLPVTIPVDKRTPFSVREKGAVGVVTEYQRSLCLSCGVDADAVFGAEKAEKAE